MKQSAILSKQLKRLEDKSDDLNSQLLEVRYIW